MKICYSCFKEYEDEYNVCPFCGEIWREDPIEPVHLRLGTVLADRYIIGLAIGAGGFGIIYKAWDKKLETIVAVKEFFASRLMTRAEGTNEVIVSKKMAVEFEYRKTRFLAEARNMAKFGNHRSIPNVFEFLEDNGTSYIVMELLEGEALNRYLRDNGGIVDKEFALFIINEVGNALISLHEKGIIHRDVAPDNIYICSGSDIRIKLLDLGAAKLADSPDDTVDIILKPGYSPVEQYDNSQNCGPWTDVYALGATLYVMLTGIKPEESTNRKLNDSLLPPNEVNPDISENLSNSIMKAMAIDRHMRFKSVSDFLKAINGGKRVLTLAKERKLKRRRRYTGIILATIITTVAGIFVFHTYEKEKKEEVLDAANITIWYSLTDDSSENDAMQSIKEDFESKYPVISIELLGIPEDEYVEKLEKAAEEDNLPTLFESDELPQNIIAKARNVDEVLDSEMAADCLFLDQYDKCYSEHKQIPMGIEIPIAVVITNGVNSVSYDKDTFLSVADFGSSAKIAFDDRYESMLSHNYALDGLQPKEDFFDNANNKAAVLLSSSMVINEVRESLTNYSKKYVYPSNNEIYGKFVYEWSIGQGSMDEIAAAEKLLSWMLGYVYQNTLMISQANDGQVPINKTAFEEKINQTNYAPIEEIYQQIVIIENDLPAKKGKND